MSDENKKCAKKKAIMIIAIVAAVLSVVSLVLDGIIIKKMVAKDIWKDPVVISKQYDKGQSMEKALAAEKPMVIWFYTDWCGFCQRFAPTFGEVTKDKRVKKNLAVAYVNAEKPENAGLMQEYNVQGFPTVYLYNPKTGEKIQVDNGRLFEPEAKENLIKEFVAFGVKDTNEAENTEEAK